MKKSAKITGSNENDIIIVGKQEYQRREVLDKSGHFQESFYKSEINRIYDSKNTRREYLRIYRHLKNRYSSIDDWYKDDLIARIGRESADSDKSYETRNDYRSRWYIYYLCIFGLRLDYPYLFSIRSICGFTKISQYYGLDYGMSDLRKSLENLTYIPILNEIV